MHTLSQEEGRAGNGEAEEDSELPSGDAQLWIKPRFEPTFPLPLGGTWSRRHHISEP